MIAIVGVETSARYPSARRTATLFHLVKLVPVVAVGLYGLATHMRKAKIMATTQSYSPRLVERALDVLTVLADGPRTFTEVSRSVGLSKATVHRILAGLAYRDFVVQNPLTGQYMLGAGSYRLGREMNETNGGIASLSRAALASLNDATQETVVLHVRLGRRRVCVSEFESPHSLKYVVGVGTWAPLHVGAAGKVLLAWSSEAELSKLLPSELERLTDATITDRSILLEELAEVRRQGWAESHGERITGAFALSAPVFDDRQQVVAVVSVLGPETRLNRTRSIELRRLLLDTTVELSAAMGAPAEAAADPA